MKLISVALAALLLFLVGASAGAASKKVETCLASVRVTVPVIGKTVVGSAVARATGSPNDLSVDWGFTGTIAGTSARAEGKATARWSGHSYRGTITSISKWDMAGLPRPALPLSVILTDGSKDSTVVVSLAFSKLGTITLPLSVQGIKKLPPPPHGNLVISVTNVAAHHRVRILPPDDDEPRSEDGHGRSERDEHSGRD